MINLLISYYAIPHQDDLKSFYALLEKSSEQIQDIIIKHFQKDFPKPIKYHVTTVVSPEESIDNAGLADSSKPRYLAQKPQTLLQTAIPHSSGVHSHLFQAAWDNNYN